MVNGASGKSGAAAAERALALGYAPAAARPAVAALWALDARLGDILRTTREPLVGQMRLTWWRDALTSQGAVPVPAEPVLAALARDALPRGVSGADCATLIDGWEALLDAPVPGDEGLARYATGRGGRLFGLAARLLGAADARVERIGEGWALADLAANLSDAQAAARAAQAARDRLTALGGGRWISALRPLAAMALLARDDLAGGLPGAPNRVARLLLMRLTGR